MLPAINEFLHQIFWISILICSIQIRYQLNLGSIVCNTSISYNIVTFDLILMLKIINQSFFFGYDSATTTPKIDVRKKQHHLHSTGCFIHFVPKVGCKFVDPNKCYVCQFSLTKATFLSKVQHTCHNGFRYFIKKHF